MSTPTRSPRQPNLSRGSSGPTLAAFFALVDKRLDALGHESGDIADALISNHPKIVLAHAHGTPVGEAATEISVLIDASRASLLPAAFARNPVPARPGARA